MNSTSTRLRWLIAEVVVIVLGVLIALGIDSLRERVAEARLERAYLVQLIEDLAETERQIESALQRTASAEESAAKLLDHLRSSQRPDADSIRSWLSAARYVNNPVPVLGTVEALVSTGDLRLLQDPTARVAVTRWMSRSRDFWLVPLYQLEDRHARVFDQLLHKADLTGLEPDFRGRQSIEPGARRAERPPFPSDARTFSADPEVHSLVADLVQLKAAMVSYRSSMGEEAAQLRGVLEPLVADR